MKKGKRNLAGDHYQRKRARVIYWPTDILSSLPCELFHYILSFFKEPRSMLLKFSSINTHYYSIVWHSYLWSNVDISTMTKNREISLNSILRLLRSIERPIMALALPLSLRYVNLKNIKQLVATCPELESLSFRPCYIHCLTDNSRRELAHLKNLKELSLTQQVVTDVSIIEIAKSSKLHTIVLKDCYGGTEYRLYFVLKHCVNCRS